LATAASSPSSPIALEKKHWPVIVFFFAATATIVLACSCCSWLRRGGGRTTDLDFKAIKLRGLIKIV
jgi:hypothetical protein